MKFVLTLALNPLEFATVIQVSITCDSNV